MSKKKENFIDRFLDKIILLLTGLAALYLLWAFVLSNPYSQKVNGRSVGPSQIDKQNKLQSQDIEKKLQDPATAKPYEQDKSAEYLSSLGCTVSKLALVNWPLPGGGQSSTGEAPIYVLPQIPSLENIKMVRIRGTVRMPMEEVTPEFRYESVSAKAEDMDFVTFSAHLDVQTLYNNFRQSFMGPRLKPQWKDATYAEPVPARVELQRRVQNTDGSWGEWQTVPFTRIDCYQKMLKDIPLTTDQMAYGDVTLFMNSCREFSVMKDILQPEVYEFLSSNVKSGKATQWMPAEYYEEFNKLAEEEGAKTLREERERKLREREPGRPDNRPGMNRPQHQPQPGRNVRGENPMDPTGVMAPPVKPTKQVRTAQDIEKDAESMSLTEKFKFNTSKNLMVWVHDDTVVPGATYQYRIRYGVFNPVAGKDWLSPESKKYKNQIILWSDYTEFVNPTTKVSESVSIPKMLQLFPVDVLANGAGINVEIYKYYMGQWHLGTFDAVYSGQMIGKPKELDLKQAGGMDMGGGNNAMAMMGMNVSGTSQPVEVDYSTGYMLMDVQVVMDWSGSGTRLREVPFLWYLDENNQLRSMAAKKQFWSKEMSVDYNSVKTEMQNTSASSPAGMMPGEGGMMQPGMTNQIRDIHGM